MTIVVAAMTQQGPRMACDSLLTDSSGCSDYTQNKVFSPKKNFLVGVAGDLGMVNLVRLQVDYSKLTETNIEKWLYTSLLPQIRALKEFIGSVEAHKSEGHKMPDLPCLAFLSRSGAIYEVNGTDVVEHKQYCCIGSGAAYAKGAIWCGLDRGFKIQSHDVDGAVRCAIKMSSFCGGDIIMRGL